MEIIFVVKGVREGIWVVQKRTDATQNVRKDELGDGIERQKNDSNFRHREPQLAHEALIISSSSYTHFYYSHL